MTLQRRALRPRAATVSDNAKPDNNAAAPEQQLLVRAVFGNGASTMVRAFPSTTMEAILREVCSKKGLVFEDFGIDIVGMRMRLPRVVLMKKMRSQKGQPDVQVDLDRPIKYYKLGDSPAVRIFPSKEKSYSTMVVTEGDRDVLVITYTGGVYAPKDRFLFRLSGISDCVLVPRYHRRPR